MGLQMGEPAWQKRHEKAGELVLFQSTRSLSPSKTTGWVPAELWNQMNSLAMSHSSPGFLKFYQVSGFWSSAGFVAIDLSSRCVEAVVCFHRLRGDSVRAEVFEDVTDESLLVTSRTRGTLWRCAETFFPAACGSRCEGQNTWKKTEGGVKREKYS